MKTQSTTITTTSSTKTKPNPFQTPIKKEASGVHTASNTFFMQSQRISQNAQPKTEEELLAYVFSPENIKNAKNLSYNNNAYLRTSKTVAIRKRRFIDFDEKIDQKYPFLRYTTDKLRELLDDANDINKASSSESVSIQPPVEMLTLPHQMEPTPQPIQPIGNLQKPIESMAQTLTPSANFQTTADNKIPLPVRRQLFPKEPTADIQKSGAILHESLIETALMQISDYTPVKHKFSYLCNSPVSSPTQPSTTEKAPSTPFMGETKVQFRFVIGSSHAEKTLFAIGHDDRRMSHGQLAAQTEDKYVSCNAAGIIGFEKCGEKWFIKTVSNKTGHFKCGPESFLTTIGMLFTDFSDYLSEEITLINESLENPKDKKSFTFTVSDLKKRYEDSIANMAPATPRSDIPNTVENTTESEANSLLFFSTPKKQKPNVRSFSAQDNELVQLPQGTDNAQADQPSFEFH